VERLTFRISVKASLILLSTVLAVGLVTLAAFNSFVAWQEQRSAEIMLASNQTSDQFLASAGAWAVERGLTNAALASATTANSQTLSRIAELRQQGDAAFHTAMQQVTSATDAEVDSTTLNQVQNDYAAVKEIRVTVDKALQVSANLRDPSVVKMWVPTITTLIMSSQQLRLTAQVIPETALARAQVLQEVKQAVWVMSEYAGRERAAIGAIGQIRRAYCQQLTWTPRLFYLEIGSVPHFEPVSLLPTLDHGSCLQVPLLAQLESCDTELDSSEIGGLLPIALCGRTVLQSSLQAAGPAWLEPARRTAPRSVVRPGGAR